MDTAHTLFARKTESIKGLIENAKQQLRSLGRAAPDSQLPTVNAVQLRSAKGFAAQLKNSASGALSITLSGKTAGVVVTPEKYSAMVAAMESLNKIIVVEQERLLSESADEFDRLMARIRSQDTESIARSMTLASDDEINASYAPGATEGRS